MSVNRSEFQIHVGTTADLAGLASTIEGLKKARDMVAANGQDTAAYDAIIKKTEGTFNAAAKKLEEMGHAAHEAGVSHHEMHQALHLVHAAVGEALGPIGEFARLLGNPYIMAAAGATLAIKMLVEQHEKLKEELEHQLELSQEVRENFRKAHVEAAHEAADAIAKWDDHLKHAHDSLDLLTEAMQRHKEMAQQMTADTNTLREATEKLYEARLKLAQARGDVSDPMAADALRKAQEEAQRLKDRAEDKAKEDEAAGLEGRANAAKGNVQAADAALPGLRDQRAHLDESKRAADLETERRRKRQEDLDKAAREADAAFQVGQKELAENPVFSLTDWKKLREERDRTKKAAEDNQADTKTAEDHAEGIGRQLEAINADIAAKERLRDKEDDLARADAEQAAQIRSLLAAHQHERNTTEQVNRATDRVNRRAELTKKQRDGTISADEFAEFSGMNAPAGGTLSDTARQLQAIEKSIKSQGGRGTADQEMMLKQLYERLIGTGEQENLPPDQRVAAGQDQGRIAHDLANSAIASGQQTLRDLAGAGVTPGGSATPAQMQQLIDMQHQFADMIETLHLKGTRDGDSLSALVNRVSTLESRVNVSR